MELILFFAVIFFLVLIPAIPSIVEWVLATDELPLRVVQEYDMDIRYFAKNYRGFLDKNFADALAFQEEVPRSKIGKLNNDQNFMLVRKGHNPFFSDQEKHRSKTSKMIVSESDLSMPGDMLFETEVFSKNSINSGEGSRFRALHAEKDIVLNSNAIVLRWVHSGGILKVEEGCSLYGRASADEKIEIANDCYFERLNAPQIVFGGDETHASANLAAYGAEDRDLNVLEDLDHVKDQFERRWIVRGNCTIPENSFFDGDIVATKSLTIGANCHITGSLKSNGNMVIEQGAQIEGSIFSTFNITVAENCRITGPMVAEDTIKIGENCVFGNDVLPTTISAPRIRIEPGVVVYGTIWAEENGITQSQAA